MNAFTRYKKALAGLLLDLQKLFFGYLHQLEKREVTDATITEMKAFLNSLNVNSVKQFLKGTPSKTNWKYLKCFESLSEYAEW
jgi:hypothetical protein